MKTDYSQVFVKVGRDSKAVKVDDLIVNGHKLGDLLKRVEQLESAYTNLTEELKTCHIIKKQQDYLIDIDGQLKKIKELKIVEYQDTKLPINFYKIIDGELVEDKEKVGAV